MGLLSFFSRSSFPDTAASLKPLPWTDEDIIHLHWEKLSGKAYRLTASFSRDIDPEIFEISMGPFDGVSSDRLSTDIKYLSCNTFESFSKALQLNDEHRRLTEWWTAIAYTNPRLFQFDFEEGPWDIPWEMLIGLLRFDEVRQKTSIVRSIGQPDKACKTFWTESLRILIIQAKADDIDLGENIEQIIATWSGLEENLRKAVSEPKVIDASSSAIVENLRTFKPHMVWFLGHGYFNGEVQLVFSNSEIVTASGFAQLFDSAKHYPEFAVFWSCETSKGTKTLRSYRPDLFSALSSKGVGTMIGMQSEVASDAACVMSTQLLRGIAQGLPLEWAIAGARSFLCPIDGEEKVTMDWAAPVVWTSRRPVARLKWSQSELDQLQLQLLGSISIQRGQPAESGLEVEPPDGDARRRAKDWLPFSVTIVRGDKNLAEHKLWFLRTLKGVQAISNKAVLVIEPEDGKNSKQNMQRWALGFLESLNEGRIPEELSAKIDILSNDAEVGWRQMCSMNDIVFAVMAPPPANEDWFWTPLLSRSDSVVILTMSEIPNYFRTLRVNYVDAGDIADVMRIETAAKLHYRLLVALSLLNLPIRSELLTHADFGQQAEELFLDWFELFVRAFGGYVVRADVRERILSVADVEALSQGCRDCLELTKIMGHVHKTHLKDFRIDLFGQIGEREKAGEELSDLLHLYRQSGQQVPAMRAIEKHFELRDALTNWEWLQIAGTYLRFGYQRAARFWLKRVPSNPLDISLYWMLNAEHKKNEGDIDTAREYVERAIRQLDETQANEKLDLPTRQKAEQDYLEARHERARLLHFQSREYHAAAQEYGEIISTIENSALLATSSPQLRLLLAVAHRNLGECILDSKSIGQNDRWREAEWHFLTALEIEEAIASVSHLIPEVYYQLARIEFERLDYAKMRDFLDSCIASAEECHYGQLSTIAGNRLLWLDVNLNELHWGDIGQQWDLIADRLRGRRDHTWDARTLINSNVNVAAMLVSEDELSLAREHLEENVKLLKENNNLRRAGDLDRIAKTLAGLSIVADTTGSVLSDFGEFESDFPGITDYARGKGWNKPEEVWEGGLYYGYKQWRKRR